MCSVLLAGCGAGEKAGKATDAICISLWDEYENKCGDPCVESTFEECSEIREKYADECPLECKEPEVLVDTKESEDTKEIIDTVADEAIVVVVPGAITPKDDSEFALEKPTPIVNQDVADASTSQMTLETIEIPKACAACAVGFVVGTHCEDDHYWEEVYDGTQDLTTCECGTNVTQQVSCEIVFPGSVGCLDSTQCS